MYKDKTFLAIIPARGGSKRLPNKNIRKLASKPLILWTIEEAKKSKYLDRVVVNSDSDKILEIAKSAGVEIYKRPLELGKDKTTTIDVIINQLETKPEYKNYDYIVLLQPTSPLRKSFHIDEAIEELLEKKADAIVSVCEVDHPVQWCNTLPENKSLAGFLSEDFINKRSQDLEKYYRLNGAIYICKIDKLLKEKNFFVKDNIYAYIMDKQSSVDIDDEFDFKFAEFIINK